ncbi:hypothetical protein CEXT_26881 [Caerostris extrusa]|uniref:Uncharacterized protein n=1 Tax=Caerostris extrusa TaxID=172846 RepID=A0AAV4SJ76_CAEEX|nr:hypothetical protein CEXT_26881 [Caerostris extrusa]
MDFVPDRLIVVHPVEAEVSQEGAVEGEECSSSGGHIGPAYSTQVRPIGVCIRATMKSSHYLNVRPLATADTVM